LTGHKGSNLTTSSAHKETFNYEKKIHHHAVASQLWPKYQKHEEEKQKKLRWWKKKGLQFMKDMSIHITVQL
jgi:hypothetical protein